MALAQRRPARGLIQHSDRGCQDASRDYQQLLAKHGLRGSMSRSGDCWDNAIAESFFTSLKLELVCQVQWRSRLEARPAIFDISSFSIAAGGAIRHSAISAQSNLNAATIRGWLLNPGEHQLGASSTCRRMG
jgi:transposase InsO family protein